MCLGRVKKYYRELVVRKHRRLVLFFFLFFFVIGVLATLAWQGEQLRIILDTQKTSKHEMYQITVFPGEEGEIWVVENRLHAFGEIIIHDSYNRLSYLEIGTYKKHFYSGNATLDTHMIDSGLYTVDLVYHDNSTGDFRVYISEVGLDFVKMSNTALTLSVALVIASGYIPAGYVFVMRPARKLLARKGLRKETLDLDIEPKQIELITRRTDMLIEYLAGRIDYYRHLRTSQLTIIGVMLAGDVGIVSILVANNVDPVITVPISLFVAISIIASVWPVHLMLASSTDEYLPPSSWYYRGMITENEPSEDMFNYDLNRNFHLFALWDKSDVVKDNIRQLVSLYYILRKVRENYHIAQSWMAYAAVYVVMGFVVVGSILLNMWSIFNFIYLSAMICLLLVMVSHTQISWQRETMCISLLTLYYCPRKKGGEKFSQEIVTLVTKPLGMSLRLVSTCKLDDEAMKSIYTECLNSAEEHMKSIGRKPYQFGPEECPYKDFGRDEPVLVVNTIGAKESVEIYPCLDENDNPVGIKNYMESL